MISVAQWAKDPFVSLAASNLPLDANVVDLFEELNRLMDECEARFPGLNYRQMASMFKEPLPDEQYQAPVELPANVKPRTKAIYEAHQRGLNTVEIATEAGCSRAIVYRTLAELGIRAVANGMQSRNPKHEVVSVALNDGPKVAAERFGLSLPRVKAIVKEVQRAA